MDELPGSWKENKAYHDQTEENNCQPRDLPETGAGGCLWVMMFVFALFVLAAILKGG